MLDVNVARGDFMVSQPATSDRLNGDSSNNLSFLTLSYFTVVKLANFYLIL